MKKTVKRIAALALALMLVMTPGAAAFADGGELDSSSGIYNGSRFISGQNVLDDGQTDGILAASGYDVQLDGSNQYTCGAGYNVRAMGVTANDAFLAGYNVNIGGSFGRDVYAAGYNVSVDGNATIGRDVYLAGNSVNVGAQIGGDVYIAADKVSIPAHAAIAGKIYAPKTAEVTADKDVLDKIEWYESESSAQLHSISEAVQTATVMNRLGAWFVALLGLVAVALVLLWLTPLWEHVDTAYYGAPFDKLARTFGIGVAVLVGVPVVAILLMITRVGARLALVLLFVYGAAIAAAPVFLGFVLGALFWRAALKKAPRYLVELPLGMLICRVASAIPGLSFAVSLVAIPLGLGMMTKMLGKGKEKGKVDALPVIEE